jgi:hypothetical protein
MRWLRSVGIPGSATNLLQPAYEEAGAAEMAIV